MKLPRPIQNLRMFIGTADSPAEAAQIAESQARDYLTPRQWKKSDGMLAYTIDMRFHSDGYGCTCAISVLGPEDETHGD